MPRIIPFTNIKMTHKVSVLLVVVMVAAIGTYLLTLSHAATPYVSISAAGGSLANGAKAVQNCNGANGGSCVVFGSSVPMDGNVALALTGRGTPFAPTSFWNTALPANTPLNPNNAAYISNITNQLCYPNGAPQTGSCATNNPDGVLETTSWSASFYVVPANQPCVPVILNSTSSGGAAVNLKALLAQGKGHCPGQSQGVPMPADAVPAGGTDAHMAIYQPSSDTLWEFWRLSTPTDNAPGAGPLAWNSRTPAPSYGDRQWHAVWGGVMNGVSQSNGITGSNSTVPPHFAGWASGLSVLGSLVRIEELQAGQIDHVMGLSLDNNLSGSVVPAENCPTAAPVNLPGATNGISWPADDTDGTNTDPCAIPEGQRFRLPANFNLTQYNQTLVANHQSPLTPVAMAIAVAAQNYGFVVNQTGPNVGIDLGDPTPYINAGLPNPYTSGPGVGGVGSKGLFDGLTTSTQVMANFPWSKLQALPFNYGESGS